MSDLIQAAKDGLEAAKKTTRNGGEYWMGRDLQRILGYTNWDNFEKVVLKAKDACTKSGVDADDHFLDTKKVIEAGKGAQLERADYYLTRYACYLVCMSGDAGKVQIAMAHTYFAVKTRLRELDELTHGLDVGLEKRKELRGRVSASVLAVNKAAQDAGVKNFGLFQGFGIFGLYQMGLAKVKERKGLAPKDDLFDHAGPAELAANDFRLTQTQQKLEREKITGEQAAMEAHKAVAAKVRATIKELGGVMPEDLPAEESLKKLAAAEKKKKKLTGPGSSTVQ